MTEVLLPVVVGGLIAIAGGVAQTIVNAHNEIKRRRLAKREEAYLEFIDALLKIKIDYQFNEVDSHDFWPGFNAANAKLNLYGSKKVVRMSQEFLGHLHDCWENHWDRGTETKKYQLIDTIRKELSVK